MIKFSVEISAEGADFIDRYAAWRNTLAEARGEVLRKSMTRKNIAESMLADAVTELKAQLAEMIRECGQLPSSEDTPEAKAERDRYAKKFLAWEKRNPVKSQAS